MQNSSAALQELLDKQACVELVQRYSRALDWLDDDALKTVFWPDAEIDFGFFKGRGDQFSVEVMKVEHSLVRRWHMTASPLVRVSGDVAEGECYGLAAGIAMRDGRAVHDIFGGRYLDRFARRGGEWRIARRIYVADWQRSFDADAAAENGLVTGLNWSNDFSPAHPWFRKI
ncbi:MAG TPA: nuclear transport factor 2 family protein [Candidatus Binataceae bacterium]|nr:nuclear transport factor 2 family protein [Candidatus Binataceae bacterium]